MATSESDEWATTDEDLYSRRRRLGKRVTFDKIVTVVDSESDDDTECTSSVPTPRHKHYQHSRSRSDKRRHDSDSLSNDEDNSPPRSPIAKPSLDSITTRMSKNTDSTIAAKGPKYMTDSSGDRKSDYKSQTKKGNKSPETIETKAGSSTDTILEARTSKRSESTTESKSGSKIERELDVKTANKLERKSGKKLDEQSDEKLDRTEKTSKVDAEKSPASDVQKSNAVEWGAPWHTSNKPDNVEECWEQMDDDIEIPEELKSDKKFKEVFSSDGWENMEDDVEIPDELTEKEILPVLDRLSLASQEQESASGSWGWGSWGVTSFINTASAGVSALTSHVSQGLSMLEESIGVPDPEEMANDEKVETEKNRSEEEDPDTQMLSFGFNNLMSGMSSITKLVESTGNKVIASGLDTLENIGKKTMEVLQEGDPGLKKKRAFFAQEGDKPILSQILREAKDKADAEEKTLEEKELARKVHFESLFDDYQGLVHLEALEMLSRQCDMKIQQRMIALDGDELSSLQETLEEVNELCDLGDEDEEEDSDEDLGQRLKDASKDLGIEVTYDKLLETWQQTRTYISTGILTEPIPSDREIFQRTISTLAQFTAFSVERFHKTAELLLIKERRSTVNEADALVQLTNILSREIGSIANSFADKLNERMKTSDKSDSISANITTIFLEAANASSYVQDAFKLLIPVLQIGAT